jgi:hypothetical protein
MPVTIDDREFARLVDWLLAHGNPVVRFRTLRELVDKPAAADVAQAQKELLGFPFVQQWLDRLDPGLQKRAAG